jgi:hypothetical protein
VCRATVLDGVAGGGARGELLKKDLACLVCGCAAGDPSYVAARRRTPWSESVRGEGATKAATVTLTRRNYKQKKIKDFNPCGQHLSDPADDRERRNRKCWWRRDRYALSVSSQGALTLTHSQVSVSRVCSMMCTAVTQRWPSQLKSG